MIKHQNWNTHKTRHVFNIHLSYSVGFTMCLLGISYLSFYAANCQESAPPVKPMPDFVATPHSRLSATRLEMPPIYASFWIYFGIISSTSANSSRQGISNF